jgi:hypothetical protein
MSPRLPLLLLLCATPLPRAAAAATLQVPAQHATVQAAVDAAQDGDVIAIAPGSYVESVVIAGKQLTLQSDFVTSGDPADVAATVIGAALDPEGDRLHAMDVREGPGGESAHVVFVGLSFANGNSGVLIRPNTEVELLDSRVVGNVDGVELEGGSDADQPLARAVVRRSVMEGNRDDGVDVDRRAELWIEDSTLRDNGDDGIEIRLQDSAFAPGEQVEHVILRTRMLRNGEDGLQLIDDRTLTPRAFRIERNVFAENVDAGLGMMCDQVSNEDFEGCPLDEPVWLRHNSFVGNDHGLTGGAVLRGAGNLFVGNATRGVRNVAGASLLAFSLFHANGEHHEGSDASLDLATTLFADPLLAPDHTLGAGSPAIDAGTAFLAAGGETVLDLDPCEYHGAAPDLGAFERDTGPALLDMLSLYLAAGADDGAESGKGKTSLAKKSLALGSKRGDALVALRFDGVPIAPGAEILAAHVQLAAAKKGADAASLLVRGEASDHAAPLGAAPFDLSLRDTTAAEVVWPAPAWAAAGEAGPAQRTPDLAALLQEIVDHPGWAPGHALALLVGGSGKRTAAAFESSRGRTRLHVELTPNPALCAP